MACPDIRKLGKLFDKKTTIRELWYLVPVKYLLLYNNKFRSFKSTLFLIFQFMEVCKKSKWKFMVAFAMKGGGGSRGGLECHIPILKNDFFKNHLESFPDCENVFCT